MRDIQEIIDYYNTGVERTRLHQGSPQVERIRIQELILRHLPSGTNKIADVGGGTGYYSFWLNKLGHEIHFLDPSSSNVDDARIYSESNSLKLASLQLGDARTLPYPDNFFDVVLMLGPLYHLLETDERHIAIRESYRVLKKGGILLTSTISRFASMFAGFFDNLVEDPDFFAIMKKDLQTGIHINATTKNYFTSSYFHTPEKISQELEMNGYTSVKWFSIDGFGWLLPNIDDKLKDEKYIKKLLDILRQTETEKSLAGISAHHLTIGFKQRKARHKG